MKQVREDVKDDIESECYRTFKTVPQGNAMKMLIEEKTRNRAKYLSEQNIQKNFTSFTEGDIPKSSNKRSGELIEHLELINKRILDALEKAFIKGGDQLDMITRRSMYEVYKMNATLLYETTACGSTSNMPDSAIYINEFDQMYKVSDPANRMDFFKYDIGFSNSYNF